MSLEAERYERVSAIVADARGLSGADLTSFLDRTCGDNPSLRAEVEELVALSGDEDRAPFADSDLDEARRALEGVLEPDSPAWLPERIGDYTIVRLLGQGGMGVVYEAEQASPRRRVALKLLHPMHATPERLRRFRHEAALLGRLQHPGIAQIFEASTYDVGRGPQPFFAMELVDGVDIRTHCERGELDRSARLALLAQVADAVHYAHEHGIIHRDLKPDNVLVDANGNARILDFGVARASSSSATLSTLVTEEGQLVGTLAYMAPEQLDGAADAITPKSDVYALGVLAFELLVGRLPRDIEDLSLSRAIALLATTDVPHASTFDPSLRGDVETILGKALESDPARRYETPAALAGDLRRHLAHRPILARPPSRIYLARKFTRRHRGLVAGTVATILTLIAGAAVAIVLARKAQTQRDLAMANELRAINGTLQAAQILVDAGKERDALSQLLLVPEESRGPAWHLLHRAAPFLIEALHRSWQFVGDEHMVTADGQAGVSVYSLAERRTIRETFTDIGVVGLGPAASCGVVGGQTADGALVLLDLEAEVVLERSPAGMLPEDVSSAHHRSLYPRASNDGRTVLWYTSPSEAEVRVDGELMRVVSGLGVDERARLGPDGVLLAVNRRDEVSVFDVASGALRFHYAFDPEQGASGFPVIGGVLLHSAPEHGFAERMVWRRFELGDSGPAVEAADPFRAGFVSPWGKKHQGSYSDDGRFLAMSEAVYVSDGALLANPETGAPLAFATLTTDADGRDGWLPFTERTAATVLLSPSGSRLAAINGYAHVPIVELDPFDRDPRRHRQGLTFRGHAGESGAPGNGWIYHLAISNDGSLLASAAPMDPLVRVWDLRTGETVATLERECHNPASWDAFMAFGAKDERLFVTTPYDGVPKSLVEWNLVSGEVLARPAGEAVLLDRFIEALAPGERARLSQRVQMDGERALVAFHAPSPIVNFMGRHTEGEHWSYLPGVDERPTGMGLRPGLPHAAVVEQVQLGVTRAGHLTVIDSNTGEVLERRELPYRPWCAAYSPDGSTLAIGTHAGLVLLLETESYTQQLEWRAHDGYVYSIAWTPDGTRLVTASGDETLRSWETHTRLESRLERERWVALRDETATLADPGQWLEEREGLERQAARTELIRRAHAR
jgi:WD40 repeat protein